MIRLKGKNCDQTSYDAPNITVLFLEAKDEKDLCWRAHAAQASETSLV